MSKPLAGAKSPLTSCKKTSHLRATYNAGQHEDHEIAVVPPIGKYKSSAVQGPDDSIEKKFWRKSW